MVKYPDKNWTNLTSDEVDNYLKSDMLNDTTPIKERLNYVFSKVSYDQRLPASQRIITLIAKIQRGLEMKGLEKFSKTKDGTD